MEVTSHEKAIHIIELFGIKPKKVAEIIGKSQSVVYDKMKGYDSNRFLVEQLELLQNFIKENAKKI